MAMFSGDRKPDGGSRERSKSPNVVCTRTGPSEKKNRNCHWGSCLVIHSYHATEQSLPGSRQSVAMALPTVTIVLSIFYIVLFNFIFIHGLKFLKFLA
jgi:hypothetical protein